MEHNIFSIKDLENLSGIKAHTIRIWEQRYHFLKPGRTDTNIRFYEPKDLKTILNVSLLNKHGYKISHIDRMDEQEVRSRVISLSDKEATHERLVNDLIAYMIDYNIARFVEILDQHILANGIDKTINTIIFPFLHRIGILWVTNHVNPAQEHLVTNLIRQKLIFAIENTITYKRGDSTVMLFLPEGERHEMGILYVTYLLKSNGVNTLYLGADVPLKDLEEICRRLQPDYVYTHLTSVAGNFNFDKFVSRVSKSIGVPFVISGQFAHSSLSKIPADLIFLKSIPEVLTFIQTL